VAAVATPASIAMPADLTIGASSGQDDEHIDQGLMEACVTAFLATGGGTPKSTPRNDGSAALPEAYGKLSLDDGGDECDSFPEEPTASVVPEHSAVNGMSSMAPMMIQPSTAKASPALDGAADQRKQLTLLENALGDYMEKEGKSAGMTLRLAELRAYHDQVEAVGAAMEAISSSHGPHPEATWKAAALWSLGALRLDAMEPFLRLFGLRPSSEQQWWETPQASGVTLELSIAGHTMHAGHRWYSVECKLHRQGSLVDWLAPRRLSQLRLDLHDPLKDDLGAAYGKHFAGSPFAKRGGPSGTTARLQSWMAALAKAFNTGLLPPRVAVVMLSFLQIPKPKGVSMSSLRPATLRLEGGESDSQWGAETASQAPSLIADSMATSPRG